MKNASTITAAMAAALAILTAPAAFAKAHDQGSTDDPGSMVFEETVEPAQMLGAARGNSANTPAADKSNRPEKK